MSRTTQQVVADYHKRRYEAAQAKAMDMAITSLCISAIIICAGYWTGIALGYVL